MILMLCISIAVVFICAKLCLRTPKHTPKWQKNINKYKKMYVILFITHHRYHSLAHLKTTAIEIQGIKIIKKNETRRKEHSGISIAVVFKCAKL
jgi:hypothetical protein